MNLFSLAERLQLRELRELSRVQLLQIREIRNEPEVRKNMYTSQMIGEGEHLAWLERVFTDYTVRFLAIFDGPRLIGASVFSSINAANKRADWAFYLRASAQGLGIGAAAEILSLDYAFDHLGLEKINGEVLAFNLPVLKLHSRFGFVEEGLRRRHIWRDGEWVDSHLIGITREEWAVQRARFERKAAA